MGSKRFRETRKEKIEETITRQSTPVHRLSGSVILYVTHTILALSCSRNKSS